MDNKQTAISAGGLYVRGVIVSSQANAFQRKDGSGLVVKVSHEIATSPGVVLYEQYMDPKESADVKVEDGKVVSFPRLAQFSTVMFKVLRYRFDREKLILSAVEEVA